MTARPPPAPTVSLTRIARYRPGLLRRLPWPALAIGLAIKLVMSRVPELDCRAASAYASADVATAACEPEYLRTGDPEIGALLADAELRGGHHAVAGAIANGLLVTSARADALSVLGAIAAAEHRPDAALRALRSARALHRAGHAHAAADRDDQAIARLQRLRAEPCTISL